MQHVLPKGFVKVRYFGWLSAAQRPLLQLMRLVLPSQPATVDELILTSSLLPAAAQPAVWPHCQQTLLMVVLPCLRLT